MTPVKLFVAGFLTLVMAGGLPYLVYRDARRIDVDRPERWTAIVAVTSLAGVATYLAPFVPLPGTLAFFMMGPVFYLFERDDAEHGDEPADPHVLPNAGGADQAEDSDAAED